MKPDALAHAVRLATGGVPDPDLEQVARGLGPAEEDPVAALALKAPSRAGFLVPDIVVLRLLEHAATLSAAPTTRARVLIRWARELLADPSTTQRRRELADEATELARKSGDPGTLAEVLDGRLHALWDPLNAPERLSTGAEIVERARQAADPTLELRGLFWRFTAQPSSAIWTRPRRRCCSTPARPSWPATPRLRSWPSPVRPCSLLSAAAWISPQRSPPRSKRLAKEPDCPTQRGSR